VLASSHPPLICGMNLALVEGLLEGASVTALAAVLDPRPMDCCVVLREAAESKTSDS
jgi:predicted ArsR family transcriptional regulator